MGVSYYKLKLFYFLYALCTKRQRNIGIVVTKRTAKFNCIWSTQYIYVFLVFLPTYTTPTKIGLSKASRQCSL